MLCLICIQNLQLLAKRSTTNWAQKNRVTLPCNSLSLCSPSWTPFDFAQDKLLAKIGRKKKESHFRVTLYRFAPPLGLEPRTL